MRFRNVPLLFAATSTLSALAWVGCARVPPIFVPPAPRLPIDSLTIADHRQDDRIVILAFGDAGTGSDDQMRTGERMGQICDQMDCDFALVFGDSIYERGVNPPVGDRFDPAFEEKFEQAYAMFGRFDFWIVAGNHDWYKGRSSVDTEIAYSKVSERWRMPAYDYQVPNLPEWLTIYGIDTVILDSGRRIGQLERASDVLCGASGWKLLFGHHAIYSSGQHGGADGEISSIKRPLLPIIEECGIDLYLSGHDHHQEHLTNAHFDQIVQGAAARLRRVRDKSDDEKQQLFAKSALGFAILDVRPERLEIVFYGFDRDNDSTFGELYRTTLNQSLSAMR